MSNDIVNLGFNAPVKKDENTMGAVGEARATAEVQAAFVIAKKFPRNQMDCYSTIIDACKRPFLAEQAMYAYKRGTTLVKGASIRLAEAMAQAWGNLDCGVREISQSNGVSVAEAYAIDLQTNTRITKIFHVKHERHTKNGVTKLTDPRDIYELVANQGARRMRACILGIIPGDVVEAAVDRCTKTLESSEVPIKEQIQKMVLAFDEYGVKVEHLEKRLGHKLDCIIPQEIVTLKSIYKSMRDGMSDRLDWFELGETRDNTNAKESLDTLLDDKKKHLKKLDPSQSMANTTIDPNTGELKEDVKDKK